MFTRYALLIALITAISLPCQAEEVDDSIYELDIYDMATELNFHEEEDFDPDFVKVDGGKLNVFDGTFYPDESADEKLKEAAL